MRDGLYKVEFETPIGARAGIAVLQGGQFRGGDSVMYYIGTYTVNGDELLATVFTNRHTHDPGIASVLGRDQARVNVKGRVSGNVTAELTGESPDAPGVALRARLTWLGT